MRGQAWLLQSQSNVSTWTGDLCLQLGSFTAAASRHFPPQVLFVSRPSTEEPSIPCLALLKQAASWFSSGEFMRKTALCPPPPLPTLPHREGLQLALNLRAKIKQNPKRNNLSGILRGGKVSLSEVSRSQNWFCLMVRKHYFPLMAISAVLTFIRVDKRELREKRRSCELLPFARGALADRVTDGIRKLQRTPESGGEQPFPGTRMRKAVVFHWTGLRH